MHLQKCLEYYKCSVSIFKSQDYSGEQEARRKEQQRRAIWRPVIHWGRDTNHFRVPAEQDTVKR